MYKIALLALLWAFSSLSQGALASPLEGGSVMLMAKRNMMASGIDPLMEGCVLNFDAINCVDVNNSWTDTIQGAKIVGPMSKVGNEIQVNRANANVGSLYNSFIKPNEWNVSGYSVSLFMRCENASLGPDFFTFTSNQLYWFYQDGIVICSLQNGNNDGAVTHRWPSAVTYRDVQDRFANFVVTCNGGNSPHDLFFNGVKLTSFYKNYNVGVKNTRDTRLLLNGTAKTGFLHYRNIRFHNRKLTDAEVLAQFQSLSKRYGGIEV